MGETLGNPTTPLIFFPSSFPQPKTVVFKKKKNYHLTLPSNPRKRKNLAFSSFFFCTFFFKLRPQKLLKKGFFLRGFSENNKTNFLFFPKNYSFGGGELKGGLFFQKGLRSKISWFSKPIFRKWRFCFGKVLGKFQPLFFFFPPFQPKIISKFFPRI